MRGKAKKKKSHPSYEQREEWPRPGAGGKHVQRLWGRKQLTYFSLTLVSLYETLFVSFSLFLSFFLKYLYFSSGWQCTQLKIFFSSLICILHWRCHTALINKVWAVRILVKAFIFLIQALLLSFLLTIPLYLESTCGGWRCNISILRSERPSKDILRYHPY